MTLDSYNIAKYGLMSAEKNTPYKGLRFFLSPDSEKQSYVEFYIWHSKRAAFIRKRVIINAKTLASRKRKGELALQYWKDQLRKGVVFKDLEAKSNEVAEISNKTDLIVAAEYYLEHKKKTLSANSTKGYSADILRLKNYLQEQNKTISIGAFDEQEAYAFFDAISKNALANRSVNNTLNGLTTLFNFFIDRKILFENPFKKIKRLPDIARKHTAMPPAVCRQILAEADPQLSLFCQIIYYCMVRPGRELINVQLKHVHTNTIEIIGENSKNGKTEHIGIPDALKAVLAKMNLSEYPQDYYLFGNGTNSRKSNNVFSYDFLPAKTRHYGNYFYKKHKAILDKLDLDKYGYDLYCWKHSGAIALFNATQNLEVLRKQLRHADLSATQKYLRDLGLFMDYSEINKVPSLL